MGKKSKYPRKTVTSIALGPERKTVEELAETLETSVSDVVRRLIRQADPQKLQRN
jgi:hypothetical protein